MSLPAFTAKKLIYQAYRDIGGFRPGSENQMSADVLNDCLDALNQMLDSWNLDELKIPSSPVSVFNLTVNVQQYTIGPGATFDAPRPTGIDDANVVLNNVSPVVLVPVKLINVDEWSSIQVPVLLNGLPQVLYYDYAFDQTHGWANINLWPAPQAGYQLQLYTWQQMQQFADLTTAYIFPPGYPKALRKNLALEIAPMMKLYLKTPEPMLAEVARQANESLEMIRSYNAPDPKLYCDPAMNAGQNRGGFNYLTGLVGRGVS